MKQNDFGLVRNFDDDKRDEVVFMTYEETRDYIVEKLSEIIDDIQSLKDIGFSKRILEFIKDVVVIVQEVDDEFIELSGEKKLTLVTDIIVSILYDELDLDIPYIPEFVEKKIFLPILINGIIPFIVDWVKNKI